MDGKSARIRISEILSDAGEPPREVDVTGVVMQLIDEDVSQGEYGGCSSELDLMFGIYECVALRMLEEGW